MDSGRLPTPRLSRTTTIRLDKFKPPGRSITSMIFADDATLLFLCYDAERELSKITAMNATDGRVMGDHYFDRHDRSAYSHMDLRATSSGPLCLYLQPRPGRGGKHEHVLETVRVDVGKESLSIGASSSKALWIPTNRLCGTRLFLAIGSDEKLAIIPGEGNVGVDVYMTGDLEDADSCGDLADIPSIASVPHYKYSRLERVANRLLLLNVDDVGVVDVANGFFTNHITRGCRKEGKINRTAVWRDRYIFVLFMDDELWALDLASFRWTPIPLEGRHGCIYSMAVSPSGVVSWIEQGDRDERGLCHLLLRSVQIDMP